MTLLQNLIILPLGLSAVLMVGIGIYAFRRRDARGASGVVALVTAITWWCAFYAALLVTRDPAWAQLWFRVMYLGTVVAPPAFLVFTCQFVGRERWITPGTLALLAIEPVVVSLFVCVDPQRGVLGGVFHAQMAAPITLGPGFIFHSGYAYLLMVTSYLLLAGSALRAPRFHRKQATLLFAGSFAVIGANILSITYLLPRFQVDVTAFGFVIMGLLMVYSLRGQGLLELLPIARHGIVEAMQDGVLVVDARDRAVDINPAARRMLQLADGGIEAGVDVSTVFPPWDALLKAHAGWRAFSHELQLDTTQAPYVDVQATPLQDERDSLGGWIVVLRDITRIKTVERQLRAQIANNEALQKVLQEQAVRDSLTGLYNRRFLEETLAREVAQAGRQGSSLAVCILDIDCFKQINDTHGHGIGDGVLQGLAASLTRVTRTADVACRYGGEEFVLVMPDTSLTVARERMDALRVRCKQQATDVQNGEPIRVSFSAGVACFPRHGLDARTVLAAADRALYDAKAAGRDRVSAADSVAPASSGGPSHSNSDRAIEAVPAADRM